MVEWLFAFRMYVPSAKIEKLDKIDTLRKLIEDLMKKRGNFEGSQSGEAKGFFKRLSDLFSHGKKREDEENKDSMKIMTEEDMNKIQSYERQLELLITDECLLCGSISIETIDMPFDSPEEVSWAMNC